MIASQKDLESFGGISAFLEKRPADYANLRREELNASMITQVLKGCDTCVDQLAQVDVRNIREPSHDDLWYGVSARRRFNDQMKKLDVARPFPEDFYGRSSRLQHGSNNASRSMAQVCEQI